MTPPSSAQHDLWQCGADSLAHDRLGCFNLTLEGHANCVKFMKTFQAKLPLRLSQSPTSEPWQVPLILLGGGGYTIRNVARCWALETATAIGKQISDEIPMNDFLQVADTSNMGCRHGWRQTAAVPVPRNAHCDSTPGSSMARSTA